MSRIVIPLIGVVKSGGLRVLIEVANGLALRGHNVTLVTTGTHTIPFAIEKKVEVLVAPNGTSKNLFLKRLSEFIFLLRTIPRDSDVLISNYYLTSYIGFLVEKAFNIKHVYFVQDYEADFFRDSGSILDRLKRNMAIVSYKLPSHIITISRWIQKSLRAHTKKYISIVNDGVNPNVFYPALSTSDKVINHLTIMTIARKEKRKGFLDFIRAAELLWSKRQDFNLRLVSSDRNIVIETYVPYELHFPATDEELSRLYNASTIFVSTSHLEGFCLPPLEAMACGIPVVTTDSGGINDFAVNEMNSLIVRAGDIAAIAESINTLLDNPLLRKRLAANGLHTAATLTWNVMVNKFERELLRYTQKLP